jgi:hypothetical protein
MLMYCIVLYCTYLTYSTVAVGSTSRIASWIDECIYIGVSRERLRTIINTVQIGINVLIPVAFKFVLRVKYDVPLACVVVPCEITGSINDFFVIPRVVMHIQTLGVDSINGVHGSGSQFKWGIESVLLGL